MPMRYLSLFLIIGSTLSASAQDLNWIRTVDIRPDGKVFAIAGEEREVRVYETESGKLLRTLKGPKSHITCIAYSRDGKMLAACGDERTVRIWDGGGTALLKSINPGTSYVTQLAWIGDTKLFVTSGYDNYVKVWDAQTGKLVRTFPRLSGDALGVAVSPTGETIFGCSYNESKFYKTSNGKIVRTLAPGQIMVAAFSPDGRTLATDSHNGRVNLWDVQTGKVLWSKPALHTAIGALAFSPNANILAISSYSNKIEIWDAKTGEPKQTLTGHTENVSSLDFSNDGLKLLSGSFDGTAILWDITTGEIIHKISPKQ